MGGNKQGGLKAKRKLVAKDPDYYKKLGAKGGQARVGPFTDRKLASRAGIKGNLIKHKKKTIDNTALASKMDSKRGSRK